MKKKEPIFRFTAFNDAGSASKRKKLGEVASINDNFIEAAFRAARDLFKLPCARRDTGWPGKPGFFVAYSNETHQHPVTEKRFYLERAS